MFHPYRVGLVIQQNVVELQKSSLDLCWIAWEFLRQNGNIWLAYLKLSNSNLQLEHQPPTFTYNSVKHIITMSVALALIASAEYISISNSHKLRSKVS